MPPVPGLTPQQVDALSHKHDGFYGALAPQNLQKKRPKPPFDLTGTWFVDLRHSFLDFMFGPPYPEFHAAGQQAMQEAAAARAAHKPYRDSIGQCYPAGMPMIMTRVWPISMVQLPTVVYMLFGFTNSMRFIYLDGRPFTDPDIAVPSYNGESIGHWEGDAHAHGRTAGVHLRGERPQSRGRIRQDGVRMSGAPPADAARGR